MSGSYTSIYLFLALCVGLLLVSSASVAASDAPRYELEIFEDQFCDCDSDCRANGSDSTGCLTDDTDPRIKSLNRYSDDYIEAAHKKQQNGVCAKYYLVVDDEYNELDGVTMTEDCTPQYEIPEEEKEPEDTSDETASDVNESSTDEESTSQTAETNDVTNTNSQAQSTNTTANITQQINQTQQANTTTEEDTMISISTIALTVIVLGFFGLMGWIAYLLKN
jgi:cobalamin biosynthesis Mg chelatase CobN